MEDGFSTLVYLGNDLNDLSVMRKANFSVAPSDAHPVIQKCASVVLPEKGGHGFVRNFVDTLLQVEALSLDALEELCL